MARPLSSPGPGSRTCLELSIIVSRALTTHTGMKLRKLQSARHDDHLVGIAPIYKVSLEGEPALIGTGFWVTSNGHLVTAWHVINDNIGEGGIDRGPIYAMQTLPGRIAIPRVLRKSYRHGTFDLALSETFAFSGTGEVPTFPLAMTLDEPTVGSNIFTHAFLSPTQDFAGEKLAGSSTATFVGRLAIPDLDVTFDLTFMARVGFGKVTQVFEKERDSVMLPFPCFQSNVPIYGANSGGPVFDESGRICGINCTSYEGSDISFHVPMKGVLDLWARDIEFIPEDPVPRGRTLLELGLARRALFDPPLVKVFFSFRERLLLWPYHQVLACLSWARWLLSKWRLLVRNTR